MQVLTFDAASDTWRPAAPPEVGVPDVTLAGDVSGPAGTTQIDRLQGKTVAAAAPGDQQVLTFDAATDTWLPATVPIVDPPAVVLAGDVVGPAGATAVIALQNVPVAAGAPVEGQVLTVVGGQWQAAPVNPPEAGGDFVEHPKALPRYAIVAAGFVRANGSSNGPVYNGLSCKTSADGVIRLVFGSANERFGYRQPDEFLPVCCEGVAHDTRRAGAASGVSWVHPRGNRVAGVAEQRAGPKTNPREHCSLWSRSAISSAKPFNVIGRATWRRMARLDTDRERLLWMER